MKNYKIVRHLCADQEYLYEVKERYLLFFWIELKSFSSIIDARRYIEDEKEWKKGYWERRKQIKTIEYL